MSRMICLLSVLVLATGCMGGNDWTGGGGEEFDEVVEVQHQAMDAYTAANDMILTTRPEATELMATKINLALVNNGIMDMVDAADLEAAVTSPLTDREPTNTCPYLEPHGTGDTSLSCRYLVDRAIDDALLDSAGVQDDMEQAMHDSYDGVLDEDGEEYVEGWIGEALLSGIDSGASHTIRMLRDMGLCDQEPTETEAAFSLGVEQGQALLENAEEAVIPTIPTTQCNTDVIARTVLGEAEGRVAGFIGSNPVCAGYDAGDLASAVDLAQAENNRRRGVDEGLRQAYEALRVRLVETWECTACRCYIRYSGRGPTQCFLTDRDDHPRVLIDAGVPMVDQSECSETPVPVGSPLVVDLDGDGVQLDRDHVSFDVLATGAEAMVPALAGQDALLVLDLNGDGQINSGAELFGNATSCEGSRCTDGLGALAQHDGNGDGVINSADPVFSRLRLWRDEDRDGRSSASELSALTAAGIRSINLSSRLDQSWANRRGSVTRSLSFERQDGTGGIMQDVWFSLEYDRLPADPRSTGVTSTLLRRDRGPSAR